MWSFHWDNFHHWKSEKSYGWSRFFTHFVYSQIITMRQIEINPVVPMDLELRLRMMGKKTMWPKRVTSPDRVSTARHRVSTEWTEHMIKSGIYINFITINWYFSHSCFSISFVFLPPFFYLFIYSCTSRLIANITSSGKIPCYLGTINCYLSSKFPRALFILLFFPYWFVLALIFFSPASILPTLWGLRLWCFSIW